MKEKYTINTDSDITYVCFNVDPTYELIIEILDILVAKNIYKKRLYDVSKVKFDLTMSQLQSMAEYGKIIFTQPSKAALYVTQALAFGEGRQFSVYREEDKCKFAVFKKKEDAISWLKLTN